MLENGEFEMPGTLRIAPSGSLAPLEVSTAYKYLQLINQIALFTSAIV